jgi:OOP family OmpA-OmpF porin
MKKVASIAALSAALVLSSAPALAADQTDGGFFVRGTAGQSNYRVSNQYFSSNTGFGWGLGGGYRWATTSGNWGVDAGYVDLGKAKLNKNYVNYESGLGLGTQGKASSHGWSIGGNYLYQFDNNWNVQARTGMVFTHSRASVTLSDTFNTTTYSYREGSSNTSWYGGVGVGYDFSHNLGLGLTYDYYRIGFNGGSNHASLLSLAAEYRF